ncbi:porin [Chitinimonas sp. PSY-7]|uniref:porin n=1 Tax=Chitinimonas sp. PSY-7 TaxID=3459088 RepID=UPI00403FCB1D
MNKKFIALAVAAAVAPAAFAADEVVLYGQVNVAIVSDNTKDNTFSVDDEASRIGVKGSEGLGNGMNAWFQIESKVRPDDANQNGFATREGWVGLKSSEFGGIQLGRGKSAYTKAYEEFDPWYQDKSFSVNGDDQLGYTGTALVPDKKDGGYKYRTDNTIRYTYSMPGMDVMVDYSVGENKNKTTGQKEATNLSYSVKGTISDFWYIVGANMGRNLTNNGSKLNNVLLGGGTAFGDLALGAGFQRHVFSENGYGTNKRNSFLVNAMYNLEGNSLYGGVIIADKLKYGSVKLADSRYVRYGAGLAVPLSKRTNIVTEYMATDFAGSQKDTSYFSVGAYHSF